MPALPGTARLAVPVALRGGGHLLPHRPVHQGSPIEQGAAGADPGRPRPGPAVASGHSAAGATAGRHPAADIRIGYARCSTLTQELQSHLDALAAHGIDRDKIFSGKISTRVRLRPQFEAALALARQIKAHAPHCRVILTVNELKRLGRDAAELTALGVRPRQDHRLLTCRSSVGRLSCRRTPGPGRPASSSTTSCSPRPTGEPADPLGLAARRPTLPAHGRRPRPDQPRPARQPHRPPEVSPSS